jgi:hypothetical protein
MPYLKKREIWTCPTDNFTRGANTQATKFSGFTVSYFQILTFEHRFMMELEEKDSNHGLVTCLTHGRRVVRRNAAEPLSD